jgi:hypothetical protein
MISSLTRSGAATAPPREPTAVAGLEDVDDPCGGIALAAADDRGLLPEPAVQDVIDRDDPTTFRERPDGAIPGGGGQPTSWSRTTGLPSDGPLTRA